MNTRYFSFLCLLLVALLSVGSCKRATENRRIVSVSILPQKYLIEKIAGDYLQVNVMVPPGMNPATCDLNTGQLKKLYDSDLYFAIGYLPFEQTHLYPVLSGKKEIPLINHSEGLQLLSGSCGHQHADGHGHGGIDPHIWLSPANVKIMAKTITKVLSQHYPEEKNNFQINYERLSAEIDSVAARAEETFRQETNKTFLIYHPALTYFASDYGLEQISIEDEGKEPNPAHLKKLIDLARSKNIRMIFIQNQFDVNNAGSIAREIGAQVIPIDPLAENWTEEMIRLIEVFKVNSVITHD